MFALVTGIWSTGNGYNLPRLFFLLTHQLAWRFIVSAIMISPFILLNIALRGKFSPRLRSCLLAACFLGLFLPFQRGAFYFFNSLFPFVRNLSLSFQFIENGVGPYDIFESVSALWLIGFLIFFIRHGIEYRNTIKLLQEGKLQTCASYFHRFRSKIYLPPDFESTYTELEQKMLLAHEHQHIAQHDPFLYRFLAIIECACWFNPLVSVAVRHFQHERELLCDERVTKNYSRYDYGMLILKAASGKKAAARAATAGIIMEFGSISERLTAMLDPIKTAGKRTAAVLIFITITQLAIGFMGFRPSWFSIDKFSAQELEALSLQKLNVYQMDSLDAIETVKLDHIEGMEDFVYIEKDGLEVDELGMYEYALSIGYTDESCFLVSYTDSIRPAWGAGNISSYLLGFELNRLKVNEMRLKFTPNTDLYSIITDILF